MAYGSGLLDTGGVDPNSPDYAVQLAEIARRRKLIDALTSTDYSKPQMVSGHYVAPGWSGAVGQIAQALIGRKQRDEADTEERDVIGRQRGAEQNFFNSMPQGTPAQPAVQGQPGYPMPPAELGGGPAQDAVAPRPAMPAQGPDPAALARWASQGMGISPGTQAVATQAMKGLVEAGAPIGLKDQASLEIMRDDKISQAQTRIDALVQREREMIQRSQDLRLGIEQRAEAAREAEATKRQIAADKIEMAKILKEMAIAGRQEPKQFEPTGKVSLEGNPLVQSRVGTWHEIVDGVPAPTPYKGKTFTPGDEKNVAKVAANVQSADYADQLAKEVEKNPAAFGPLVGMGESASSAMGGAFKTELTGLSDKQQALRSKVFYDFAERVHALYGSALTASEKSESARWSVRPGMSANEVATQLRGQAEFMRKKNESLGIKANEGAAARKPVGGSGSWGDGFGDVRVKR